MQVDPVTKNDAGMGERWYTTEYPGRKSKAFVLLCFFSF